MDYNHFCAFNHGMHLRRVNGNARIATNVRLRTTLAFCLTAHEDKSQAI